MSSRTVRLLVTFTILLLAGRVHAAADSLMPRPAQLETAEGRLPVRETFRAHISGPHSTRLESALARALRRWEERTGLTFPRTPDGRLSLSPSSAEATLVIHCETTAPSMPTLGEDESYSLDVTAQQAVLRSSTSTGALRGLETLLQLLQLDEAGWFVSAVSIRDQPRFPWRGLLIDVCRHWQPMEVIKRNLDGMALVKLNVLHLHLTEDQGFRIESKTHPRLHELGSDGLYFTQDEIREIIAYAADRGIRVVPEFDIPGHATSWLVAYPELGSAPGPYAIERKWGIFDPVLDPTNEQVYALLEDFFGEMAALFPDPYLHIGGDENNGKHWSANERIQNFIREHNLADNAGIHAYFNRRVRDILQRHGKKLVGWDEILHPDIPKDAVIQSWRGPEGLAEAARRGYTTILSNGYYIDLCHPASQHYLNDPLPANTPLSPEEQARILGGEATMWAELVTPETIDSRIWPRTAAIAERLWSPREVNDVADMYRRLAIVSRRLEEAGLLHERNRPAMIRRLAGDAASEADLQHLSAFVDLIEPLKQYDRHRQHTGLTQHTPLIRFADCARPESDTARAFAFAVESLLRRGERERAELDLLTAQLATWQNTGRATAHFLETGPSIARPALPLAHALIEATTIGLGALDALRSGKTLETTWQLAALDNAAQPHDALLLPIVDSIRKLVTAASAQ